LGNLKIFIFILKKLKGLDTEINSAQKPVNSKNVIVFLNYCFFGVSICVKD